MKKVISFLLIAFIFISCSKANKSKTSVDGLFINVGAEPQTIDPTLNKASDASVYIIHAFEGLPLKIKMASWLEERLKVGKFWIMDLNLYFI